MKRKQKIRKRILALALSSALMLNGGIAVLAEGENPVEDDNQITVELLTEDQGPEETRTTTSVVTDENGNVIQESGVITGSETSTEEVADPDPIEIENLQEGTNTGTAEGTEEVTGDVKEDEDDTIYDQTTVTTTDRNATVEVSDTTVSTGDPIYNEEEGILFGNVGDGYHYYWSDIYTADGKSIIDGEVSTSYWKTGTAYFYSVDEEGNAKYLGKKEGVCQRVVAHDNNTPYDYSDDYEVGGLYCADFSTGIQESLKYRVANLDDANYYTEEEAAHLRAILMHGYTWDDDKDDNGVEGDENLANIKAMLLDAKKNGDEATRELLKDLTEEEINALTRNQAATATGMAIWTYGNRFEMEEGCKLEVRSNGSGNVTAVDKVYKYLISLTEEADEDNGTPVINEEKFIDDLKMIIRDKVAENENNADEDDTNDVYGVDLQFSLVVTHIGKSDDLVVKIVDSNGNVVKTARIAGNQKDDEEYAEVVKGEDGKTYYVIKGLELMENSDTTFALKMEGIQQLEEGIYIFESQELSDEEYWTQYVEYLKANNDYEDLLEQFGGEEGLKASFLSNPSRRSQNFIGCFSGEAEVDVSMELTLNFDVEEATKITERIWGNEWVRNYDPQVVGNATGTLRNPINTNRYDYDVETASDDDLVVLADEEVPMSDQPDEASEDGLVELEDDEVPMADAPETGSPLGYIMIIMGLSGLGLSVLEATKRKEIVK